MQRKIKRFGGSLGIIIGKYECQQQKLEEGDDVDVEIKKIEEDKKHGKRKI